VGVQLHKPTGLVQSLNDLGFVPKLLRSLPVGTPPAQCCRTNSLVTMGGPGRIRTSVGVSRQIYSLLPLSARAPTHEGMGPRRPD
jgi:hypothetical protein